MKLFLKRLDNLTDLADLLRSLDNSKPKDGMGFDMRYTLDDSRHTELECGTACCIGGWVHYIKPETEYLGLVGAVATLLPKPIEYLGKAWCELDKLCWPKEGEEAWNATPQQAARAVEILRDTGKCDWDRAMTELTA
jgi:hypothetical protein